MLPKALREAKGWEAGTELTVEETPHGLLLTRRKEAPQPTRLEDVFGMLKHKYGGPPISVEEMDEAIGVHLAADDERIKRGSKQP